MLRFDSQRSSAQQPDSTRRAAAERRRLQYLIFALALVLIASWRAADPRTWTALLGPLDSPPASSPSGVPSEETAIEGPVVLQPEIDAVALRQVQDGAVFRPAEQVAWWNLWQVALQRQPTDAVPLPARRVTYAQLRGQPQAYRGARVTLEGTIRRAARWPARENGLGLTSFVRLWLWPDQERSPVVIYTPTLPAEFPWDPTGPPSESLEVPARVTGLFFKNLLYQAGQGPRLAPVILAPAIAERRQPGSPHRPAGDARNVPYVVVCGLLLAALAWSAWRMVRGHGRGGLTLWTLATVSAAANARAAEPPLRTWLESAGIADAAWQQFRDGTALTADRETAWGVLYRCRRFTWDDWEKWRRTSAATWSECTAAPAACRGCVLSLRGRARSIHPVELAAAAQTRWELTELFVVRCQIAESQQPVWVLTPELPRAWQGVEELDEPVAADVVFLKLGRLTEEGEIGPLVVASRIGWHPVAQPAAGLARNKGQVLLAQLGMDVGRLDDFVQRRAIAGEDRQAFYQMLNAVDRVDPEQLWRAARSHLADLAQGWQAERDALLEQPGGGPRRGLLDQSLEAARSGQFSVYPLFNEPEQHVGELVLLVGTVRRALRVELTNPTEPTANADVRQRFGFDHYYELELFTRDSGNNPLVCCVRELPAGFPQGAWLHEDVRVAGFFAKSWAFHVSSDAGKQLAPLVIARTVLPWHPPQTSSRWGLAAGLAAVALIGGVCGILWRIGRRDAQYQRRAFDARYGAPPDDLAAPDRGSPGSDANGTVDLTG